MKGAFLSRIDRATRFGYSLNGFLGMSLSDSHLLQVNS